MCGVHTEIEFTLYCFLKHSYNPYLSVLNDYYTVSFIFRNVHGSMAVLKLICLEHLDIINNLN